MRYLRTVSFERERENRSNRDGSQSLSALNPHVPRFLPSVCVELVVGRIRGTCGFEVERL